MKYRYEFYIMVVSASLLTNRIFGYEENRWATMGGMLFIAGILLGLGIVKCDEDKNLAESGAISGQSMP